MIIDFQYQTMFENVIIFPAVDFPPPPATSAIIETVVATGSETNTIAIGGTLDQQE